MKKLSILSLAFLGIVSMTSCSNSEVYSLKEASGFDLSNISSVQVSESVYQSFTWNLIDDAYQYLDCDYIKVDFDINKEFLSSWPSSELKDNAYVLHVNIKDIELYKDNLSQENIWAMGSELGTIRIDANTGKLRSVSMPVREGSIPYNYGISREEARSVAYELLEKYKPIGDTGEYELVSLKRNAGKDEDAYIWYAEFHKKYGDLYNASESIKIGWIPTSNILYSLDIKQNPYENNEEKISQEEAIQIAKEKDEQIETVREIQEVKAEIKIKQMNEEVYLRENLKENYGNIMLNMEKVEGDLYRYKDDAVMYKTEERVRRVWCVVITYNPEKSGYLPAFTYYVDSTTGEIIGGGAGDVLASEEAEKNDVNNVIEK